ELANFVTVHRDHAEQLARPQHGNREYGPDRGDLANSPGVFRVDPNVGDVDGAALEGGAARRAAPPRRDGLLREECPPFRGPVREGNDAEMVAFESEDRCLLGFAESYRVLRESLEYGLKVEGGASDHLEQLGGGGLLLEGHA